jgi:two-component system, chemotaxis family, CheB/CheR fusion protein
MDAEKDLVKTPTSQQFPVVGIGGSAGGLESFKRFIKAIPEKSGSAYVVVQHLSPSHESSLSEILQKETKIPVKEIPDKVKIEPDTIYVIPSNRVLTTTDGILKLTPRENVKTNLIIDVFLTSLAVVRGSFAVGVVLSGTGSDGTVGLKMIRDYGGITIAQDQESAAFGDMPLNAVKAGVVDFVLSPEKIPGHLLEINRTSKVVKSSKADDSKKGEDDSVVFKQMVMLLYQHSGVDFTHYKESTIRRRIARRMAITNQERLEEYLDKLRTNDTELGLLFQDMLIPVTSFFRDLHIFEKLDTSLFTELFKKKHPDEAIRFWVAGCSTGAEAYSMAICLHDFFGEKALDKKIQIFASDISEPAIQKARLGIFSDEELDGVSGERLKKYFRKSQGKYLVNKSIRDICVFAVHNFLKDPPFAKMDLISCRNVFIYMDNYLQKKALTMFHYALNDSGILILGKSETASAAPEYFKPINNSDRIYSRKPVLSRFMHVATKRSEQTLVDQNKSAKNTESAIVDFRKSAESIMLSKSPASVIVNSQMDIVHIHGDINPFLRPSPGKPTFNLFKMAREGLSFELRNLLHKVKTKEITFQDEIKIVDAGRQSTISIEVTSLKNTDEPYFLIFFKETIEGQRKGKKSKSIASNNLDLEAELRQLRTDMQSVTEDHDAANEELQSINEELQSSNEELLSLNEELETSKEELQSANEELTISNQELRKKRDQLNSARLYSEAIVSTISEPLVVLDKNLQIKTINQSFNKKFSISEEEIAGKHIFDIQNNFWKNNRLKEWLEDVLPNGNKKDNFEITLEFSENTFNLILSAQQIKNDSSKEDLILLAIEDVTHSIINKRLQQSESRFRQLSDQIPHLVFTTTKDGKVNYANKGLMEYSGRKLDELDGDGWLELIFPRDRDLFMGRWKDIASEEVEVITELRILGRNGSFLWHLLRVIPQKDEEGKILLWIGTFTNIQEQKDFSDRLTEEVEKRTKELVKTNDQLSQFAYTASHDLQEPLRKIMTFSNQIKQANYNQLHKETKTYLDKIENASARMSTLIHDLLNFSRIADSRELFQETDLNDLLKNVIDDFELLIEEKNAEINYDVLPKVMAIPLQMNQLFYNLVGNALKFSRSEVAPRLVVSSQKISAKENTSFKTLDPSLNYFEITFKDNGIGFDQKYADQIFQMFQRLNQPSQYAGTGIGLALSKKIVEIHNGEIFAASVKNEGTEIHVILPENQPDSAV